jgi:ubiquinone/menaquinone biosynthesis C-methylase UbiE
MDRKEMNLLLTPMAETSEAQELPFTGERVIPGNTPENIFRESQMRYAFAAGFVKGRTVVDVACGTGIGTNYLLNAGAAACYGFDVDTQSISYAKSQYGACEFAVCDAHRLRLADMSVDIVVSFETIEHLTHPPAFLLECQRVLRPNGILICSTPDRNVFRWVPPNPFHLSEMRPDEFLALVKTMFTGCSLYGQSSVNYPAYIAEAICRNRIAPLLDRFHLKKILKQFISTRPIAVCTERQFSENHGNNPEYEVLPYSRQWFRKQPYVIVVAKKPSI